MQVKPGELQKGGGSGLGLWVAKNIIEAHGGQIGVYSKGEGGFGSTFYIDMPISVDNVGPREVHTEVDDSDDDCSVGV